MKRKLFLLAALFVAGLAKADDGFTVADVTIGQGKTAQVVIVLNATAEYKNFQFDLSIPEGISPVLADGVPSYDKGEAFTGKTVMADGSSVISSGARYLCNLRSSPELPNPFPTGTHEFVKLNISAAADMEIGQYDAKISAIELATNDNVKTIFQDVEFKINVVDPSEIRVEFDENATSLPNYEEGEKANIKMTRTFVKGQWNTMVLPFTITTAYLKAVFGDDAEYAYFSGWNAEFDFDNDDLAPKSIEIQFTTKGVTPNIPGGIAFLVKPTKDPEPIILDNVTLTKTINDNHSTDKHKNTRDDADGYGLKGIFKGTFVQTTVPEDGLFISDNQFWYSTGATNMKAFRGWFELGAVLGKDSDFGVKMRFILDGQETKINEIQGDDNEVIYDLSGRRVEKATKGIYIINGKKVLK